MYIHDTQAKLEIENTNFSCDIFAPALEPVVEQTRRI